MNALPAALPFRKMHGLGNDFVVLDARADARARLAPDQVRAVGDRRRGVGFDQLLTLEPSARADVFLRIHNPDGSESGACGNGTRCVAALVMDQAGRDAITIETIAGLLPARRLPDGRVSVDMGAPRLDWRDVPLARAVDTLHVPMQAGPLADGVAVSMGNPHVVFFTEADPYAIDLATLGPQLEHDPLLPQRGNISVARVTPSGIDLRVWERGAGLTLACGSGACATLVSAVRRGLSPRQAEVRLPGGALTIEWAADDHVWMTGPVAESFTGALAPALLSVHA